MMVAAFKDERVFHRIENAGGGEATAFCGAKGSIDFERESEVISCPKCADIHAELALDRLQGRTVTTSNDAEIAFLIGRLLVLGVDVHREGRLDAALTNAMELMTQVVDCDDIPAAIRCDGQELLRKWQRGEYLKNDRSMPRPTVYMTGWCVGGMEFHECPTEFYPTLEAAEKALDPEGSRRWVQDPGRQVWHPDDQDWPRPMVIGLGMGPS